MCVWLGCVVDVCASVFVVVISADAYLSSAHALYDH